jgi:homoserine kinase
MGWSHGLVRVQVPATSANLGPGFDSLGLALTLYDNLEAWISDSGLSIEISGEGTDLAGAGEDHLVIRAMRATFAVTGDQPPGIGLRCTNRIPHGRGLGSSAAAIVAGILAARALSAHGRDKLPDDALLGLATELEGHPDNVAACLGGGLTIAWRAAGRPRMVRIMRLPSITPVVCVSPARVRTDVARQALPRTVPHADAAANAGRSALLVAALTQDPAALTQGPAATQDPAALTHDPAALTQGPAALSDAAAGPDRALAEWAGVLFDATEDWLHQDYRATAMPETYSLVRSLRAAGIPAVVSGAGPSVLAFLSPRGQPGCQRYLDSLGSIVRETGIAWRISSLEVERQGARVLRPEPPSGC